jgi:hypothetical protein
VEAGWHHDKYGGNNEQFFEKHSTALLNSGGDQSLLDISRGDVIQWYQLALGQAIKQDDSEERKKGTEITHDNKSDTIHIHTKLDRLFRRSLVQRFY